VSTDDTALADKESASKEPTARWHVIYVMPNLSPTPDTRSPTDGDNTHQNLFWKGVTIDSESAAIVSMYDSRVQKAVAEDANVGRLLEAFVDTNRKKLHPSVLIVREGSAFTREQEGIVAFRNSVALSVILKSRAAWARGRDHVAVGWSDYFDFHPLQVGTHGLISESPAQLAILTEKAVHQAMPSPYVSATTVRTLYTDQFLRNTLGSEWRKYYEQPTERTKYGRALFRSLEIAYIACGSPIKNGGSMYEWGVQLALWVSALEVLVSALYGRANQWLALDLLGEYEWGAYQPSLRNLDRTLTFGAANHNKGLRSTLLRTTRRLVARMFGFRIKDEPTFRAVNVVQHACHLLYIARHKFLHGDKVTDKILWPWGRDERPDGEEPSSIVAAAPLVYRIALRAFLARKYKPDYDRLADNEDDNLARSSVFAEYDYAEALKAIYNLSDDSTEQVTEYQPPVEPNQNTDESD
jgi:hypothetical protein